MTSLSIISGVATRIKNLIDEQSTPSSETSILSALKSIIKGFLDVKQANKESGEFVRLEKSTVQLCYEIEDAIEANQLGVPPRPKFVSRQISNKLVPASFPSSRQTVSRLFQGKLLHSSVTSSSSEQTDLESLKNELFKLQENLEETIKKTCPANDPENPEAPKGEEAREPPKGNTLPAQTKHQEAATREDADPRGKKVREDLLLETDPSVVCIAQTKGQAASSSQDDADPTEKKVREDLLSGEDPSVVCILGESGMGKITLAKKVMCDPEVRQSFKGFAWVHIHEECQIKKVLQEILLQLLPRKKADVRGMNEIQLTQEILKFQEPNNRCLFVLEDIRTEQDWRRIRVALLVRNSSKILITTPSQKVGDTVSKSKDGANYSMKPLSKPECFKILMEAGLTETEVQNLGETIHCLSQGLPLFAEILGKSLTVDRAAKTRLAPQINKYRSSQSSEGEKQVLKLCYDTLPFELNPRLLYVGQFPPGQNIEVEKLHLLLAAEDLILPEDSAGTRKKISTLIEGLACRKLMEVQEDKGSISSMFCQLHEQVRNFCISKALDEEFFEIVDFKNKKKSERPTRRLGIYLSNYEEGNTITFSSQDMVKKLRSLLIFDTYESQQKSTWPSEIDNLKEFISLRILDFDGVNFKFRKLPVGMDKLVFLRYLSFRGCCLEACPPYVNKFLLLETLDLRVIGCTIIIPNILSEMKRLRHIYFPRLYVSDDKSKLKLQGLERLEILVNFDTVVCDINNLYEFKNLQILTTISEGNHEDLEAVINYLDKAPANLQQSSIYIRNFDCYTCDSDDILKKLLECKTLQSLNIEGQIGLLPKPEDVAISQNLTEMIFDGSELKHDDLMNILLKLENLRSLELSNDALIENKISFSDALKFPNLRSLKLLNLQYLETLTFGKEAMPKLSTLVIEKCDYLDKVSMPEELHNRLQDAQREKGGDVYSVEPLITITHDN